MMGEFADMAIEESWFESYGSYEADEEDNDDNEDNESFSNNEKNQRCRDVDTEYERSRKVSSDELTTDNEVLLRSSDMKHYYIGFIKKKTEKAILFVSTDRGSKADYFWCPISIIRSNDFLIDENIYLLPNWADLKMLKSSK